MKAMILAAGRGSRLRPLTDHTPKPLVQVGKHALIEHHIHQCAQAGFESIVINIAHLGDNIRQYLGDGSRYNIPLHYSDEGEQALETGGGIAYALPMLGDQPFAVISSDVFSDIPLDAKFTFDTQYMHLFMVPNPQHHPQGDFTAQEVNLPQELDSRYTYSGIAYVHPQLFTHEKRAFPLIDPIRQCIREDAISAQIHHGTWFDVGTASRLHLANKYALQNNR